MSTEVAKSKIIEFVNSDKNVLELNYQYSRPERAEIHQFVEDLKLFSKSRTCQGTNIRLITIQKTPFNVNKDDKDFITPDLMDIFLKYNGYSMPTTEYFEYYLLVLDLYLPASQRWKEFLEEFEIYYKNDISSLKNEITKVMLDVSSFFEKSVEISKFKNISCSKSGNLNSLYNSLRHDKRFMSIDIRKSNYTILSMNTSNIFNGNNWETFLGSFTKSKFLLGSKYFRECIFGKCGLTEKTVNLSYQHLKNIQKKYYK